ncbi:hypothetical protein HDU86_007361 [Geranomyces michiganensis]|nr:hypothetical protein HDU86_007361 [Geranomyces michiganensis]
MGSREAHQQGGGGLLLQGDIDADDNVSNKEAQQGLAEPTTTISAYGLQLPATQTTTTTRLGPALGPLRALLASSQQQQQQQQFVVADDIAARWYVRDKFGARFEDARRAMRFLANKFPPELLGRHAHALYEQFWPLSEGSSSSSSSSNRLDLRRMIDLANDAERSEAFSRERSEP